MREYFYRDLDAPYRTSPPVVEMDLEEIRKLEGDTMESNVYRVDKSMPHYGVVSRCLHAIAKADFSTITRADIDQSLTGDC